MNWQYLVVALIFAFACYYIIKIIIKSTKGESHCDSGDCKHVIKPEKKS